VGAAIPGWRALLLFHLRRRLLSRTIPAVGWRHTSVCWASEEPQEAGRQPKLLRTPSRRANRKWRQRPEKQEPFVRVGPPIHARAAPGLLNYDTLRRQDVSRSQVRYSQ
jgi:hypothetical protein